MGRKLTKEEFITKATEKHGDKYDYSLVEIKGNNKTKVKIKCNTCGCVFEPTINNHLSGHGCPNCAGIKKFTKEEFLERAREIHCDKYDYSLVEIKGNNKTKVKIKCNTCGNIFEQKMNNHLNGHGCPECAKERRKTAQIGNNDGFIAKARAVHGDKYNYDNVVYVKDDIPVSITCPIHGDFQMTPHHHKSGCGCQKCKQSHLESKTMLLLERNNIKYETEKTFPWLRNKREMPLDFYLPEYNIAIECQGEQHYLEEEKGYFTKDILANIQQRDTIKNTLCKEYGIQIFYIRYDEDVEKRINEIIKQVRC